MVSIDRNIQNYTMRMNNKSSNIKWYIIGGVLLIAIVIIGIGLTKNKSSPDIVDNFSYKFNYLKWNNEPSSVVSKPNSDTPPDSLPVTIGGNWVMEGIAELSISPDLELTNPPTDSIVTDDFANNLSEQLAEKAENIKRIADREGDGRIIPMIAKVYDGSENELPLFDRIPQGRDAIWDKGTPTIDEFYLIKKSSPTVNGVVIDSEDIWHFNKRWINSLQFLFNVQYWDTRVRTDGSSRESAKRVPFGTEIHKIVFELQNSDIKIPYNLDTPIIIKKKE